MSESAETPLQFGHAEFTDAPAQTACTVCKNAIAQEYFEVNGSVVCRSCRDELSRIGTQGSGGSRFMRALAAGSAAGAVGSLIYFGISKLTGYEFGLIAALIGFAVGGAVRWGCYGRGGKRYQALAVGLTYLAIVSTYIPPIIEGFRQSQTAQESNVRAGAPSATQATPVAQSTTTEEEAPPTLAGFVLAMLVLVAIAAVAPFFAGFENIIGLIIIGFGLWEAWKINRKPQLVVTGPHAIAPSAPPPLAV